MHFAPVLALLICLTSSACAKRGRQALTLSGSTSMQPLAEKWAEAYQGHEPGVSITVQGGGSTAGIHAVLDGTAQIGLSSRALTGKERQEARAIQVARDAFTLVVHPSNPLDEVSLDVVRKIYAGRVANWKELRGANRTITVITREEGSGTRAAFEGLVMHDALISASALVQDSTGAVRQIVATDPGAIGYISIVLLDRSVKSLRLNGAPATEAAIDSGAYPLVRPFLFVLPAQPDPRTQSFIRWVTGPEGRELARREGLLPPQSEEPHASR